VRPVANCHQRNKQTNKATQTQLTQIQAVLTFQEVFSQENATSVAHSGPRQTQSLSAATARRLTRVLPPKLPDTENDGGE